jgi:hypothetical protein
MTAANMARYRNDPNYEFWKMLKVGYDHFELTRVPPKVDVCERRYVFNQIPVDGQPFSPTGACPASSQPDSLKVAYSSYQSTYEAAFNSALKSSTPAPKPTIAGIKEANIVSEWTRKRARGERVPVEPPSLNPDGTVTQTERMGRIDSAEGRRMAAIEAEQTAKKKAAEEKAAAVAAARAAAETQKVETAAAAKAAEIAAQTPQQALEVQAAQSGAPADDGAAARLKKRLLGMFGG